MNHKQILEEIKRLDYLASECPEFTTTYDRYSHLIKINKFVGEPYIIECTELDNGLYISIWRKDDDDE